MAGVEAFNVLAPDEIEVRLSAPTRILTLMTMINVFDSAEAKKHATPDDPWAKDWLSRNTAGFGPYQLVSSRPGEGAVFTVNPQYWGPRPYYDRVLYREVASPASRATLIRSKQVQWADEMPLQQVAALQKDPNVKVETTQLFGSASLRMNPKFKPWSDIRVRQAVFLALDYDAIQRVVFNGMGTRARSAVSLDIPGGVDVNPAETDLPRAKALLAEAGYADGLDVELTYSSNWWWEEQLAVQAKDSLAKAGIRVTLKQITPTEMAGRRAGRVADIPFFTHMSSPSVATPAYALALNALSGASMNPIAYSNPKVDALIKAAGAERDDATYLQLARQLQETYAADFVQLDTFHPPTFGVMAPCIRNWIWKPLNTFEWKYLVCQ
jgi:peptide/nickel transport system substrate-binding protein